MKLNQQPPEKQASGDGTVIAVNSIFHTIQGEGPLAGTPAVFLRLAGCNLQCPMCDTEYTKRTDLAVDEVADSVWKAVPQIGHGAPHGRTWERHPCDLVVITGGEPFRQPIGLLVRLLIEIGWRVQVETNGTLYQEDFPWYDAKLKVVCSPKTGAVHKKLLPHIDAFKYVATAASLAASEDGLPDRALAHPAAPKLFRKPADHPAEVYLQPVDENSFYPNKLNQDAVVRACLRYGYRLCLQTHKFIGVP